MKVLIIGDDAEVAEILANNVFKNDDCVRVKNSKEKVLREVKSLFDVIILNYYLPENKDEYEYLIKQIRKVSDVPIFVLASRITTQDMIGTLDSGADDCLAKPFSLDEFTARLTNVCKRSKYLTFKDTSITARNLQLDIKNHIVRINGRRILLTRTEYMILTYLLLHRNFIVSKKEIEKHTFPSITKEASHNVNTHILNLRKKLGSDFPLQTVPYHGFIIN